MADIYPEDDKLSPDGRVMEVLSEHQCQGWLEAYLLTGRHGFFSMLRGVHPHHRFDVQSARQVAQDLQPHPVASADRFGQLLPQLPRLAADHNGLSTRTLGSSDHVVTRKRRLFASTSPGPPNCLLSVTDHCLAQPELRKHVIAGKQPAPPWLTMDQAIKHCTAGLGIWEFASNDKGGEPDVVMACCGDVPTLETLAAVELIRKHLPELKIRVVNVVNLMKLQPQSEHPHGLSDRDFDALFTKDKPIVFAFHGYPWLIIA